MLYLEIFEGHAVNANSVNEPHVPLKFPATQLEDVPVRAKLLSVPVFEPAASVSVFIAVLFALIYPWLK